MKRRRFLKTTAALGASTLAGAAVTGCSKSPVDPNSGTYQNAGASAPSATGSRRASVDLSMVTTWPKNFPGLGTRAEAFAQDIERATNGRIRIRVYAADELVPALQAFDSVSQPISITARTTTGRANTSCSTSSARCPLALTRRR